MKDVVCLSGSMRFFPAMLDLAALLTKQDKIVLAPFLLKNGDPELATMLDALHQRKIALSNMLYVVAIGGDTGESTHREIASAKLRGIPVIFWQPERAEGSVS